METTRNSDLLEAGIDEYAVSDTPKKTVKKKKASVEDEQ